MPVALETLGSSGDRAYDFMLQLCRRTATAMEERQTMDVLLQRLPIEIQRSSAICVVGTVNLLIHCQDDVNYLQKAALYLFFY